jgi:methylamine dehydrogenase accessory protein MauD
LRQSRLGSVVLIVAFILGVYAAWNGRLGRPAPAFSLPETDGGQIDLASYNGRPVLLVFWTSSCPICQQELPMLNRLEPEFRGKGIAVVTILLGGEGEARDFLDSNRIGLTSAYDSAGKVGRAYDVSGVPKLVLIGKDGKVKRVRSGWTTERVLRSWMDSVG